MEIFPKNGPDGAKGEVQFPHCIHDASFVVFFEELGNSGDSFWCARSDGWKTSLASDASALIKTAEKSLKRLWLWNKMLVGLPEVNDKGVPNLYRRQDSRILDDQN